MTILIVDDQISVINALLHNVPFSEIGFSQVFTAMSTDEALEVLEKESVHVLLTDVEMPGRNGLILNSIVSESHPDILRIVLTSHANFTYAQESLRMRCFDYIVQPAPYEDITLALQRALETVQLNHNNRRITHYGNLFRNHKHEFLGTIIQKLYSNEPGSLEDCIRLLEQAEHPVSKDSVVQLVVFDVFAYSERSANYPPQKQVMEAVSYALSQLPELAALNYLVSLTPNRRFALLFFAPPGMPQVLTDESVQRLYECFSARILPHTSACYSEDPFPFSQIQTALKSATLDMRNNVAKDSGLFFIRDHQPERDMDVPLPGSHSYWNQLLRSGQKKLLQDEINRFLELKLPSLPNRYDKLCDLHQLVIQMFFEYFYEKGIDISTLFTAEYTFQDCMDAFSSVDDFKKCVDFFVHRVPSSVMPDIQPKYVEKAKLYISENSGQMISVKEVAEHVHLSPEYFTRLFKKETGRNIKDYIVESKIALAKDLLISSTLPVSMVALEVGYTNFSHFTAMFRKYESMTPSEYRQLHSR